MCDLLSTSLLWHVSNDIRITSNGQCAHSVVFRTRWAQLGVIATGRVDTSVGRHGVAF